MLIAHTTSPRHHLKSDFIQPFPLPECTYQLHVTCWNWYLSQVYMYNVCIWKQWIVYRLSNWHNTSPYNTTQNHTTQHSTIQQKMPLTWYIILIFTSIRCVSPVAQWYSIRCQSGTIPLLWVRVPATPLFYKKFQVQVFCIFWCHVVLYHLQDICFVLCHIDTTQHIWIV